MNLGLDPEATLGELIGNVRELTGQQLNHDGQQLNEAWKLMVSPT